jgi:hypothetical protein
MMLISVSSILTTNPSNCAWAAEDSCLLVEIGSAIFLCDPDGSHHSIGVPSVNFTFDSDHQ